jgi:hypothetical protein
MFFMAETGALADRSGLECIAHLLQQQMHSLPRPAWLSLLVFSSHVCRRPRRLVTALRDMRRKGLLGEFVHVHLQVRQSEWDGPMLVCIFACCSCSCTTSLAPTHNLTLLVVGSLLSPVQPGCR